MPSEPSASAESRPRACRTDEYRPRPQSSNIWVTSAGDCVEPGDSMTSSARLPNAADTGDGGGRAAGARAGVTSWRGVMARAEGGINTSSRSSRSSESTCRRTLSAEFRARVKPPVGLAPLAAARLLEERDRAIVPVVGGEDGGEPLDSVSLSSSISRYDPCRMYAEQR